MFVEALKPTENVDHHHLGVLSLVYIRGRNKETICAFANLKPASYRTYVNMDREILTFFRAPKKTIRSEVIARKFGSRRHYTSNLDTTLYVNV